MRKLLFGAVGALLFQACQPQATDAPQQRETTPVARFVMHVDPAARTARIEVLPNVVGTTASGVHVPADDFENDGNVGSGTAGTFEAVTTNPRLPGESGCGPVENCFEVQINSRLNRQLTQLLMRIDGTSPNTGHEPTNADMLPPGAGIGAGLGVFNFGDIPANGSSAVRDVRLGAPSAAPYTVQGSFFEESPGELTTLYARDNGGSNGGAVYFDITVDAPGGVQITGMDTNTVDLVAFTWTVFAIQNGTAFGNEANAGAWTQVATGNGVGSGANVPSPITLDAPFTLPQGTHGLAFVIGPTAGHDYTGTGSAPPDQVFSNADISLTLGTATNIPFNGAPFSRRIWNGTLYYTPL